MLLHTRVKRASEKKVPIGLTHLSEAARALDDDALLLAGLLVLSAHVQDAVSIDVEGDLNLRRTSGAEQHRRV